MNGCAKDLPRFRMRLVSNSQRLIASAMHYRLSNKQDEMISAPSCVGN